MMIVPATRQFFGAERYLGLKRGETFSLDSGLGGSHIVAFKFWNDDRSAAMFEIESPGSDFDGQGYIIDTDDLPNRLYILVAENRSFRHDDPGETVCPECRSIYRPDDHAGRCPQCQN